MSSIHLLSGADNFRVILVVRRFVELRVFNSEPALLGDQFEEACQSVRLPFRLRLVAFEECVEEEHEKYHDRSVDQYHAACRSAAEGEILDRVFAGILAIVPKEWGELPPLAPKYEIDKRCIGRGRSGRVFGATRRVGPSEDRVAVKLLESITTDLPDKSRNRAMARLGREIRALTGIGRSLRIVRILDIGIHSDCLALVLEYLPGGTLTARRIEFREPERAVELVLEIATTMDLLHRAGILHRDLKPDNILFGLGDQPVIADFGLARFADTDERVTETGSVLGTPGFLSPEQAASELITYASDIYSLGAILYYLVTGSTGFPVQAYLHRVQHETPEDPRQVRAKNELGRLDRDLSAVIMKSLRREPNDRYDTMEAFAKDLERVQIGEMPSAVRPTPIRAAKVWVRRHMLLTVVLLVVGICGFWGAIVAVQSSRHAASLLREVAELRSILMLFATTVAETSPYHAGGSTSSDEMIRAIGERLRIDGLRPSSKIYLHIGVGRACMGHRQLDEAEWHQREALRLTELIGNDPLARAFALAELGKTFMFAGRLPESERMFRESIDILQAVAGSRADAEAQLADVFASLATVLNESSRSVEAELVARRALEILERTGADGMHLAVGRTSLAEALLGLKKPDRARLLLEDVYAVYQRELGAESPLTASILRRLGMCVLDLGEPELAVGVLERAAGPLRLGGAPWAREAGICELHIGLAHLAAGRIQEGSERATAGLRVLDRLDDPGTLTRAYYDAGIAFLDHGLLDEAEASFGRILSLYEIEEELPFARHAEALTGIVDILIRRGDLDEIPGACLDALARQERIAGRGHRSTVRIWPFLRESMMEVGQKEELLRAWRDELASLKPADPVSASRVAWCSLAIASLLAMEDEATPRDTQEATDTLSAGMSELSRFAVPDGPLQLYLHWMEGQLAARRKQFPLARVHYEIALGTLGIFSPDPDVERVVLEVVLGGILTDGGSYEIAERYLRRGLARIASGQVAVNDTVLDGSFAEIERHYLLRHSISPAAGYSGEAKKWRDEWEALRAR